MGRDGDENEDANVRAVEEELLDEMFTERSAASDKDDDLTISLGCSDDPVETQRSEVSKDSIATSSTDRSSLSLSNAVERLPVLLRASSQGAYFDERQRSVDPDHTVGRTRVPWHSKSVSDLRDPATKPTRVVAFDVGGKLFRCKESLIAKYPLKRLNQIITCGCGKVSCLDDAFFIDRNPQHFEMILDWYRTGKLVRQRNVNEEAFKDDAIYFDLYEELFPTTPAGEPPQSWPTVKAPPGLPTRRRSVNDVDLGRGNTKRVSMFANMASPPAHQQKQEAAKPSTNADNESSSEDVALPTATTDDGPLRFYRRERRVLTPTSIPVVFKIRKFEQLLVASVKGRGKLMVRVCDATGMQAVDVPEAVLFDSHSRFYLKGERAQLQYNALLPGEHVYTFWIEENTNGASVQTSSPPALDIEFKLLFTFDPGDRITPAMESELSRAVSTAGSSDAIHALTPERTPQINGKTESFSPCLFLPPSQVQRAPELTSLRDAGTNRSNQVKPPKELSPLKKNGLKRGSQQHQQHLLSSPIRHAGASIVRSVQQPQPRPAEGKVTVYRPEKLELDPASDSPTIINQAVESAYHDMQPRLFR
ncbi:hypothetical protein PHYSODRAFT_563177 [Phytophthora sojae]|uniref:Potassium channel tetramerisation-type BTB domain-containing protein n=1 Tax=Phytophthora sojae (strain P6497) TaxID=1094619 RepID=G4ZWG9_PHYSP|nr:hypothetical protein PHYSODRAFT_563177 [Phytophthora sojae]EGZ12397.1 hypothetical protein PHYSODRAFT_563177 [Phytophthora sojae]|eukprot:XP_009532730.1 hypothetical protein PHYSODRAFT_563177 [Phytophthora sojae]